MLKLNILLGAATIVGFAYAQAPTVTVDNGVFVGTATTIPGAPQGVKKYLGVPYAVTPPQRFSPPQRASASTQVRQATNYGPGCIQQSPFSGTPGVKPLPETPPPDSEDCLYINVFAPANTPPSNGRSVLLWIYGGAFVQGSSASAFSDGSYLAANQDVIVVSFNYRTNVFGFPGLIPGLPATSSNVGLLDQRLALDWTRRNIAAFGGDPNKITIFGESAGAVSVDLLSLTTSAINPPFRGAIMQSGTYYLVGNGLGLLGPRSNSTLTPTQQLAAAVGCNWDSSTLACLRSKSAATLKQAGEAANLGYQPIPDGGITVPANNNGQKVRALFGGARVPTLLGTNANEALIFLLGSPGTFDYLFNAMFPELKPYEGQIRAAYPVGGCSITGCWANELSSVTQAVTDYIFTCPAAREARTSAVTLTPTWRYFYNQTQPFLPPPLSQYVFHASEIPLVFGTIDPAVSTPPVNAVSSLMMKAWANFAKNPSGFSDFKRYTSIPFLKEIAQLGGPENPNGRSDIDITKVDAYCDIYRPIYDQRDPTI